LLFFPVEIIRTMAPTSSNSAEEDSSSLRKRRLSKKERRSRKKQKKKSELQSTEDVLPLKEKAEIDRKKIQIDDNECLKSYKPIPVPSQPSAEVLASNKGSKVVTDDVDEGGDGGRTLGKWFPNALLIKSSVTYTNTGQLMLNGSNVDESARVDNPRSSLVLFYQYTKQHTWSQSKLKTLMTYLSTIARKRNLGGRIRVAQEGVNVTVSAVDTSSVTAQETLRHFAQDLRNFDKEVFSQTDFKYIDDLPADRHFKELKVIPVQELVFYGIKEDDAPLDDTEELDGIKGGVHLDAKEYHQMLGKDNTVVIDVRNHYETLIGRFDGQQQNDQSRDPKASASQKPTGAEYLDPLMRKSTDFKSWLAKNETQEKLKDKTVLMYCTGGIRCERASAYLKKKIGNKVDGVYQLQGGVERYLEAFPDGGYWRGKNFVFDKREAVGVDNPEGDGGVIRKQKKKKISKKDPDSLQARCCVCNVEWDRYVGKKKCFTCGVPVLMCEKCMSLKPDKTPGMELKVRCPLCVAENITVPASEVEFTANGIKGKVGESQRNKKEQKMAASSVLKWGGGHAAKKKLGRKAKRRLCQFGSECMRKDCFFLHQGKEDGIGVCQETTK
jgi:predicted sulfurtransferase